MEDNYGQIKQLMWSCFNESVFYSLSELQGLIAHDLRTN